jgi:Flp pilus assembly protein TadD
VFGKLGFTQECPQNTEKAAHRQDGNLLSPGDMLKGRRNIERSGGRFVARQRVNRLFLIGFLSLQVATGARAQQPTSNCTLARPYITSAQVALAKGDSSTAVQGLNRAIQAAPKCAEAYLLLGLTEFQSGATDNSIQHYRHALALQPRSYSAHYNLALAYLRIHKVQEARAQLEQAVSLDPHQADAAYDLGIVLLEAGEPSGALTQLRRARALNPQRQDVAFNIVRAQLEAGQVEEARAEAQKSAKHFGSDFKWNVAIGQLFLQKANPKDAAPYLVHASRIHPDDIEIRHQLALAYLQSGRPDEVLNIIKEPKTSDDYYLRASAHYVGHNFPEADQESELAMEMAPENAHLLALRARLLQRAGQQDQAVVMAQKAITLAPEWDEPYYLAGISYYFTRRYDLAEQNLARALELNPNAPRAWFLESIALANLRKLDDAERCLRRAIALQPTNARLYCHLGILLARRNDYTKAEESFRKAIQLKPDYALSHYELGKLLVSSKQLSPAAQELQEAVTHDPSLSAAYYQLGLVYAKLGNTEKSKQLFAEFARLHQKEEYDSQAADKAADEDTRKETESP